MSDDTMYFRYVVAQYVHSRREERLNVGVIVHDPLRSTVRSHFDTRVATRRIKTAFPDVDAKGLRLFLQGLGEAVLTHPGLNAILERADALGEFGAGWRNAIQFTSVRSVPAKDITSAVAKLAALYVAEIPAELHQAPVTRGIPYARDRTRDALRSVLHLEPGLNYREYKEERVIIHSGTPHRFPIEFPFYVYDRFVIDTLSFRGDSFPRKFDVAAGFLEKIEWVRRSQADLLVPCVSYVSDDDKPEETAALVAQILEKGKLPDEAVVEAERAEDLARYIGDQQAA